MGNQLRRHWTVLFLMLKKFSNCGKGGRELVFVKEITDVEEMMMFKITDILLKVYIVFYMFILLRNKIEYKFVSIKMKLSLFDFRNL
jgi:hypothetical protein